MRVIILGCGYLGYNLYGLLKETYDTELWGIESPYSALVKDMKYINAFDQMAMAKEDLEDAVVIDAIGLIANTAVSDDEKEALDRIRMPYQCLIRSLKEGNAKRFVYFSSGGTIYGNTLRPISENDPVRPMSLYAKSKAATEELIMTSNIPYLILRLSNPYGGYQDNEKKQGVIPILIRKAFTNEPFEMFIDGSSVRDYFYITDLAQAIRGLIDAEVNNEVVNVGSGTGTSLSEIIELVEEATETKINIVHRSSDAPTIQSIVLDITKLKELTGYVPEVSLKEGIQAETERIRKELKL
ncbi:MAG: NAD-dependent epimerase/dehydratase family protein [Solobacterium sp.]|nr:NAD-dependent epimerase/dehydratase family protein [Solobacterium sp.]